MDRGLFNFVIAVITMGIAFTVPVIALRWVWFKTRAPVAGAVTPEELDQLHARLAELEGMHERMLELEERVDFAERVIEQRSEAGKLAK